MTGALPATAPRAENPFVGSRPLGPTEGARLLGREELAGRLGESIRAARCVTVYGPPGAGKTSLLVASVLPSLAASEDARTVYIGAWPPREDPVERISHILHSSLLSGPAAPDLTPIQAVMDAAKRATRASSRLMVLCLDQVEELLSPLRPAAPTRALLVCLEDLVALPLRPVRVVLSLREDSLGRFIDALNGRLRLMEQSFRVAPFTVAEVTDIACRLAASGEPPQIWSAAEMQPLMLELREHEQPPTPSADVRLSYVQNLCGALFDKRAAGALSPEGAVRRELSPYIERTYLEIEMPEDSMEPGEEEPQSDP